MKHILVSTLLVAASAGLPLGAEAQVGVARGRVSDAEGRPLEGVRVVLEFQGDVTSRYELVTNAKGEYMRVGLKPGPYHVTLSKEGYEPRGFASRVNLGSATDFPRMELVAVAPKPEPASEAPVDMREEFRRAVELLRAGDLDEAEGIFLTILDVKSEVPEVHQNLGYLYAQRKEWSRAEASYQTALELRPGAVDLMNSLAKIYQDSGQDEKAREMLGRAANASPDDARARFNLAVSLFEAGESAEARSAFEAVLAADPSLFEAHYYLGMLLVGQGQVEPAVEHLEAYLAAGSEDAPNAATAHQLLEALRK